MIIDDLLRSEFQNPKSASMLNDRPWQVANPDEILTPTHLNIHGRPQAPP
jgi:hypothetical protein